MSAARERNSSYDVLLLTMLQAKEYMTFVIGRSYGCLFTTMLHKNLSTHILQLLVLSHILLYTQAESTVLIHPVKLVMDKCVKLKLMTPQWEIKVSYYVTNSSLPIFPDMNC